MHAIESQISPEVLVFQESEMVSVENLEVLDILYAQSASSATMQSPKDSKTQVVFMPLSTRNFGGESLGFDGLRI